MDEDLKKLGERLKELREKSRQTQKEVSQKSGLTIKYIKALENGEKNATVSKIFRYGIAVNSTLTEIFEFFE